MNALQSFNLSATIAVVLLVPIGLYEGVKASESLLDFAAQNRVAVGLALFIVLFKLKSHLDDHVHFGERITDRIFSRYVGFVLAAVSWVLFGLAAVDLVTPLRAADSIVAAFLVSSLWIVLHMAEVFGRPSGVMKELPTLISRNWWIGFNSLYVGICLAFRFQLALPLAGGDAFVIPGEIYVAALLVVLLIDARFSKSFLNASTA